jgi:hypothetical protein
MLRPVKLAALTFLAAALVLAQSLAKRLILKDGSYQAVTKWEVQGDRVHYYSAERSEWEDVPNSLVDWAATNKYNDELSSGETDAHARLAQEEENERIEEANKSPQIAPGVRLPATGGVYLLDEFHNKPELVEVVQSGGELHKNVGRNILRAAIDPLATSKQTIELAGAAARIQAHDSTPELYMDIVAEDDNSPDDSSSSRPVTLPDLKNRYRIVRVEKKKDSRIIGNFKIAFYGKVSQQENWIPTTVTPVTHEWIKVTPAKPLTPGEYALVEMLGKNEINFYVWDFGVNPSAPENPSTWTPVQPKAIPTGVADTPILDQRPPQ